MNRSIFASPFYLHALPGWQCPVCGRSVLRQKKDSLRKFETLATKSSREDPNWEPSRNSADFSVAFECTNNACGQVVLCIGVMQIEEYTRLTANNYPELDYRESYLPLFFSLPLSVFEIPAKCPEKIAKEIRSSFFVFFGDPSAALNHVRSAVELLLTHFQVARFRRVKGKLFQIKLHERIEAFGTMKPDVAQKLLAIKWIGNAGSHPVKIEKKHTLDAYEILEDVLLTLFEKRELRIRRLVNQVNKRRGPLNDRQNA